VAKAALCTTCLLLRPVVLVELDTIYDKFMTPMKQKLDQTVMSIIGEFCIVIFRYQSFFWILFPAVLVRYVVGLYNVVFMSVDPLRILSTFKLPIFGLFLWIFLWRSLRMLCLSVIYIF